MMSNFLDEHRADLITRCADRAASRPRMRTPARESSTGIPLFIAQLQQTLEAEELQHQGESLRISGAAGGKLANFTEMGMGATAHGQELLGLGYTVDEVVHTYGDLCQSVTDLAFELKAPFAIAEFRTLNRCLDNAIASAVTAFSRQRDVAKAVLEHAEAAARVDVQVQELRSSLATATYAIAAMEVGNLPMSGSTGLVLKKCIAAMRLQIGGPTLDEVRSSHDDK